MGCASSIPKKENAVHPSNGAAKQNSPSRQDFGSRSTQVTGSTPWTSVNPAELPGVEFLSRPSENDLLLGLQWNISKVEQQTNRTLKNFEEIKRAGCAEISVPKCRVTLVSYSHIWITTRTGAFSPALEVYGSPFQPNFDEFYGKHNTGPVIMTDARTEKRCVNHPGVAGRPNLRFFFGGPMISRGHFVGILYLWESHPRPAPPPPEKVENLMKLANKAVDYLQQDLFESLGATTEEEKSKIDLPTLYIDVSTPRWQILDANESWQKLTGLDFATVSRCQGLLDMMAPNHEPSLLNALASAERDPTASIPVILSPTAPSGATQQFAFALTPVEPAILPNGQPAPGADLWSAVVHARVQASCITCGNYDDSFANRVRDVNLPPNYAFSSSSNGVEGHGTTGSDNNNNNRLNSMSPHGSAQLSTGRRANYLSIGPLGSVTGGLNDVMIPPRLASLQLGPLLGKGSYGSVFLGTLQDCPVAVKVMQHAPGPEAFEQLWAAQYETMVASDLTHENVVPTIDWCGHSDEHGSVVWIVQELCDAGSLSSCISKGCLRINKEKDNPPDVRAVLETALDVARGMEYLHSHDVLHGDLSSNNVMFVSQDNYRGFVAKVTDFGLSRALGGQDISTKTVGTVSHMPPELLMEGVMAKTGDVYAFGVMLWEMWSGKRAWAGASHAQVIFAITCQNKKMDIPEDTPPEFGDIMSRCLGERSNRPTFDEIMQKLEALVAALPTAAEEK